jgi:IS5 family transposase
VTIQQSKHQIITAYEVHDRRPADMTLWTPALDRHISIFDGPSDLAAGDRGFALAKNEEAAVQHGVRRVILPRPGRNTPPRLAHERQRWFRRGQRWRVGCEGRISVIKLGTVCGCPYRGPDGTARWIGLGVIANYLMSSATFLNARAHHIASSMK